MAHQKTYKIRLHVMSPIHIGCDDVYEPTGFVIDEVAKKLTAFDPIDFMRSLPADKQSTFVKLCEEGTIGSLISIYKFMTGLKPPSNGHSVEISQGFLENYKRVLRLPSNDGAKQELNKFQISRTSYLAADNMPYIPGSAVKGSLRTGWLNAQNKGQNQQTRGLEELLLGGTFANDPFRMVKVSDLVPVETPGTRICFAVNKKKMSQHEPRGPQQILEVILPDSAVFEGMITLHTQEQGGSISKPAPASMEFFAKAAQFFATEMDVEETVLKGINLPAAIRAKMTREFGECFLKTVFPIRLGRHSGAECLTIDGVRNIKILGKRVNGRQEFSHGPYSTTVWLAGDSHKASSGLLPFGWAALEVMEADPSKLWPERVIVAQEKPAVSATVTKAATPPPPPETVLWENAVLTWSPGNAVLTAACNGKKAEIKLAGDKALVPEVLHKKLFVKKDAVKAQVTVEQQGNGWRIISIA